MKWFRTWRENRRLEREARALLARAFETKTPLKGTSLKARHANRWVLQDFDAKNGEVVSIRFGIMRHPRPYAFSRQSHKVIEFYVYDVRGGRIEVMRGANLTRSSGRDADV